MKYPVHKKCWLCDPEKQSCSGTAHACLLLVIQPSLSSLSHSVLPQPRQLWHHQALLNPEASVLIQKCQSHTGKLSSETPGDSKNAFLHCGDDLAVFPVTLH